MKFKGLTFNRAPLSGEPVRSVNGSSTRAGATVSAEVLAQTSERFPDCRCEELGLEAGMPVRDLIELGSGCTGQAIDGRHVGAQSGGWVCGRLDTVRRRYGQ